MKIEILDDKAKAEGQDKNPADKNNNDESVALDEAGTPDESEASKQKLEEVLKGEDSTEDGTNTAKEGEIAPISDRKEPIQMSIWVWIEVLKFIKRMEMANRISLVNRCLKKLCWLQMRGIVEKVIFEKKMDEERRWILIIGVPRMQIRQHYLQSWPHSRGPMPSYPMPSIIPIANACPLPEYIQGFKIIQIRSLDPDLLQFIRDIKPLLTNIRLFPGQYDARDFLNLRQLLPVLDGCRVSCLDICNTPSGKKISISDFRQNFSDCLENIPALFLPSFCHEDCVELKQLILSKIEGAKSFVLQTSFWDKSKHIPIDDIKKTFLAAVQPQSFLFTFSLYHGLTLDAFRLENATTGEVLVLTQDDYPKYKYELYRCPNGEEEEQQWREKAKQLFTEEATNICM